jgi:hypothetical protein
MGSWLTYGLGSESENLPGYVVLTAGRGSSGGVSNWTSGFLPSPYQGWCSATGASRCSTWPIRPASRARCSGKSFRAIGASTAAAGSDAGPGDRQPHRLLRAGLPHAVGGARTDRSVAGDRKPRSTLTAVNRPSRTARASAARRLRRTNSSPATACWPAGWSSAACGSSRWSTPPGTITATSTPSWVQLRMADQPIAALLIQTSSSAGFLDSTLVIFAGEFGRTPTGREPPRRQGPTRGATTTRSPSACGWPAAA